MTPLGVVILILALVAAGSVALDAFFDRPRR